MQCPKCNQTIANDSRFCPECGVKFNQRQQIAPLDFSMGIKICGHCGEQIPSDSRFCPECGTKFNQNRQFSSQVFSVDTKKCDHCGAQIPSDSRFCPECRSKQGEGSKSHKSSNRQSFFEEDVDQSYSEPDIRQSYSVPKRQTKYSTPSTQESFAQQVKQLSYEDAEKIRKRNKILGIAVLSALAFCVVIVILSQLIKPSINLNEYITIEISGYDTVGRFNATFDVNKFAEDYEDVLSGQYDKKVVTDMHHIDDSCIEYKIDSYNKVSASADFLNKCVQARVDKRDGLVNGDSLTYSWVCDDDYALEAYGVKLKYSDVDITVEGLDEAETFDPFEGIRVSFSGENNNGYASITGEPIDIAAKNFRYDLDRKDGLSVGDIVTVSVSAYYLDDLIQSCIENYGKIPSPLYKTYTVEGLDSYVSDISEISEICLKEMQAQVKDLYNPQSESNWDDNTETLEDISYIGMYLATIKDQEAWGRQNLLYLIYKVTVNNRYSNGDDVYNKDNEYYWFIMYNNILVDEKGNNTVDYSNFESAWNNYCIDSDISEGWSTKKWYYDGYETLETLYNEAIAYNTDLYTIKKSINDSFSFKEETDVEELEEDTQQVLDGETPFYGIWVYSSNDMDDALDFAGQMFAGVMDYEMEGIVFATRTWENIRNDGVYLVSAGIYDSEDEANSYLSDIKSFYPDAYVKYSGEHVYPPRKKGMIFDNSSEEIIEKREIKELTDDELRYAINELYARNGYIFKDDELRNYYERYDWYQGTIEADRLTIDTFNNIERENLEALQKERDSRK